MNKLLVVGALVIIVGGGFVLMQKTVPQDSDAMKQEQNAEQVTTKEIKEGEVEMSNDDKMMDKRMVDTAAGEESMMKSDEHMMDDSSTMDKKMDIAEVAMMADGSYEAYTSEKIARAESGDVVLFFKASWCPSCRGVDADIKAHLKDIPAGLSILEVDYDKSAELKKKYGVTYQHTFVQVDAQGNLVKKWSGSPTLAAIVTEIK